MTRISLLMLVLLTAIAPIVWGSTYIVTSEFLPVNSPLTASVLRSLPAGLLLVLLNRTMPSGSWWGRLIILGFLNIGFFFYCLFFAASHLPGGMASLVMAIGPIFVIGLSYILLNNKLTLKQIVASFLAIGSVAMLLLNNEAELDFSGILMGVLGTLSMATGIVMTKRWGRPKGMTLLNFTGWQLLFGGFILLPVAWWFEGIPQQLSIDNVLGYVYLCVVGAMFAYSIWFNGIDKLPAITVSFLGFLSSVSAVLLGYCFLGQTLTFIQCLGVLGIFISIVLSSPKTTKKII